MRRLARTFAFVALLLTAASAFAAAIFESVEGDVKVGASAAEATAARKDQRVSTGAVVVTGAGARAVLRFDDGQIVALHENSEFGILESTFVKDDPTKDRASFELIKGAMRFLSGLLGKRNPEAVRVQTPQARMGIRGTDFMLAIVNPLFFSVNEGELLVSNTAGASSFAPGATGTVAADGTFAVAIPLSSLPASVAAAFSALGALTLVVNLSLAELAATPGGVSVGGITVALPALGAVVAGIGLALANKEESLVSATATATGTR